MTICLSHADLAAVVADQLDPQQRLATEAHLDACERCQQALQDFDDDASQVDSLQYKLQAEKYDSSMND